MLSALEASLAAPTGNAFLSWLADQIEGTSGPNDYDDMFSWDAEDDLSSFGCEFEAAYAEPLEEVSHPPMHARRAAPQIELVADGWRVEKFDRGGKMVKDALGRVVEVHSVSGETLQFRYGEAGYIESFERLRADGSSHSEGARDKHGVVVRDPEGRVRAAGESMTIDPRGSFFLHTIDGQFFSVDLVNGIHSERRKITDETGVSRFVTSLFAHDGFRMATMFGACKGGTAYGGGAKLSRFRFYGRDGTLIEFATEDDLQQLRPRRVHRPAARKICRSWPRTRQATTAWDAVRDYLVRVG